MKIFQGVNKLLTVFMLLCVNGTTECSSVLLLKTAYLKWIIVKN